MQWRSMIGPMSGCLGQDDRIPIGNFHTGWSCDEGIYCCVSIDGGVLRKGKGK